MGREFSACMHHLWVCFPSEGVVMILLGSLSHGVLPLVHDPERRDVSLVHLSYGMVRISTDRKGNGQRNATHA